MVIPEKDLLKVNNPNLGVQLLVHPKARVQIAVYKQRPDRAFVEEIDGLGNVKKQTEFSGFLGFWNATAKFEEIIAENLGIQEVYGLEVGMVIELNQDTNKYKKGDIIAILAVDENGVATQTQRLNKQQVENVKRSPYVKKLRKGEDLSFLKQEGFKSLNEIDAFKTYSFGLIPDSEALIPLTYNYRGLKAQDKLKVDGQKGGGEVEIQQLAFYTNSNGKTQIAANVVFEDGSTGRIPLKDFLQKPERKTKAPKQEEQPMEGGLKRPSKKTPYYIYDEFWIEATGAKPVTLNFEGDFFIVKILPLSRGGKKLWKIYDSITGLSVGADSTKEEAIMRSNENFERNPDLKSVQKRIDLATRKGGVSPRFQ